MMKLLTFLLTLTVWARADEPAEIDGYRTVHSAKTIEWKKPVPVRAVFGKERDFQKNPFKLAVLLIDFSDTNHVAGHDAKFYDTLLFSKETYLKTPPGDPSPGSVADWYREQSLGRFVLTGKVFDWIKLDDTYEGIRLQKASGNEKREKFLGQAQTRTKAREGADCFAGFDAFLFIHAGPIKGPTTNMLWSHESVYAGKRYCTTGEIEKIGVICHEFGHVIGLPDLYGKAGVRETFGPWCTMAGGYRGNYPRSFCAWSKVRLGWCSPTTIDGSSPQKLALRPIQTNPNDAFVLPLDPDGGEFLLLENRQVIGLDQGMEPGLFIWRCKHTPSAASPEAYTLQLPGPEDAKKTTSKDRRVAWPLEKSTDFTALDDGGNRAFTLHNIRQAGGNVFFEVVSGGQ
jgi:M6 family metalloprotease-like protein